MPFVLLRDAKLAALPGPAKEQGGSGRNVLLTLARAFHAVETGAIDLKDHATVTSEKRGDAAGAELLLAAAGEYRGKEQVDWDRELSRVLSLAQSLITIIWRISE